MDKAPDAFRTISEVADDLDIPQHVLRFWETRFVQIKPMKRSGGRRYYRPDDVDLLKGIRQLLYGEGYTIRGVQRILKEHGIKAVQGIVDGSSAAVSFHRPEGTEAAAALDDDSEPLTRENDEEEAEEFSEPARPEPAMSRPAPRRLADSTSPRAAVPIPGTTETGKLDTAGLEAALQDLIACRELLDAALKDG